MEPNGKIALVDVDETICFYEGERRYDLAAPNAGNIAKINAMHDSGWRIIYWTARGSVTGIDHHDLTLAQLESWGCRFHELRCGPAHKPHFDLLIDDKSRRIEEI
jgi:CMP-N,N'-diacetyllegionaminic acid synthase